MVIEAEKGGRLMKKKKSEFSLFVKLLLGGGAVLLLILFLCFGCDVVFPDLGFGFSVGGLFGG